MDIKEKLMDLIRNDEPVEIEGVKVRLLDVNFRDGIIQITFKKHES